jgi:hypothetical protein
MQRTICLDDTVDRWRYRCPRGHASWEATNNHFWCAECASGTVQDDDLDPAFTELRDERTGETLERGDVHLVTDAGPYEDLEGHVEGSA